MPKPRKTRHYKPAAERKTKVIPVRVTAEQYTLFTSRAEVAGCGVSHWLRQAGDKIAELEADE